HALAIRTSAGTVLHTGDWKIDPTPIIGVPTDERRLRELGDAGVLALIGDSNNAVREGRSPSEAEVAKTIAELVRTARAPPAARSWWSAAPWSAWCRWRAKPDISMACRISAVPISMGIFRRTRCWRCAPEARVSRVRRCHASPMTIIRR